MSERVLVVPGPPVPWSGKVTNFKTGNRFIPNRQAEATGRVLDAIERASLEPFAAKEPLLLSCVFYVKRPLSHFGSGRNSRIIKPRFVDARPAGKPDLSNLVKLLEDGAVLGSLLPDDDQIVGFYAPFGKFYTETLEEQPRSVARIKPLVEPDGLSTAQIEALRVA